jgi:hypothetical protein
MQSGGEKTVGSSEVAPLYKGGRGCEASDVHQPSCREDLLQELSQNEYSGIKKYSRQSAFRTPTVSIYSIYL